MFYWYSLNPPDRGASRVYPLPTIMFYGYSLETPLLAVLACMHNVLSKHQ